MSDQVYRAIIPIRPVPRPPARPPTPKRGLHVRLVVRMSGGLSTAIAGAARGEGLTVGAWVRRQLLDRLGMQSDADARSGRPVRMPEAHQAAIAAALRNLAAASAAAQSDDPASAIPAIQAARAILVPLALGRPAP
ncbi:hypothetical protein PQI07_11040 [Methylobacterium sp. 092160098-2]|uniref:hypothetical protein n=1 Tax=Methylobacterium sp. 092160098-2 TaxID=3025129 RepID=UPI002381D025|nr:hypothetical protein [Methylobacterium sp. 092160098-2]MDE4911228.1 hypothetical protein [Methylobacterium sp. 092160098-2]